MSAEASACQIALPLRNPTFDAGLQKKRVRIVETFFDRINEANSFEEIERLTSSLVRAGFKWPTPQPTALIDIQPFGNLVITLAKGMEATPENECNPITSVNAYYSFHFDEDKIALMNTIIYGYG